MTDQPVPALYKVLGERGECVNGGTGRWFLPSGKRPGKWMPAIEGDLVPCKNGYHLCSAEQIEAWGFFQPWHLYRAEWRGDIVNNGDKWVTRQARLTAYLGRIAEVSIPRHVSSIGMAGLQYGRILWPWSCGHWNPLLSSGGGRSFCPQCENERKPLEVA